MQPETRIASVHFKVPLCSCFISPAFLEHPTQAAVPTPSFHCSHDDHSGLGLVGYKVSSLSSAALHSAHYSLFPKLLASQTPGSPGLPAASWSLFLRLFLWFPNFCPY